DQIDGCGIVSDIIDVYGESFNLWLNLGGRNIDSHRILAFIVAIRTWKRGCVTDDHRQLGFTGIGEQGIGSALQFLTSFHYIVSKGNSGRSVRSGSPELAIRDQITENGSILYPGS